MTNAKELAQKVFTSLIRDRRGSYVMLRGSGSAGLWLEEFRGALKELQDTEVPESSISVEEIGQKLSGSPYGGDIINQIVATRAKVVIDKGFNTTPQAEREKRAIANYLGFNFYTVDDFLLDTERERFPLIDKVEVYRSLPPAIIVDLDGTYADSSRRSPFPKDVEEIMDDGIIYHVADVVTLCAMQGTEVIYVTGRGYSEEERRVTSQWLALFSTTPNYRLFTRKVGDNRPDYLVKLDIFNTHIRDKFNVRLVIDDRPSVIRMWQSLGLPVLANLNYEKGEF